MPLVKRSDSADPPGMRFLDTEREGLLASANSATSHMSYPGSRALSGAGAEGRKSVMRLLYPHEQKEGLQSIEEKRKKKEPLDHIKHSWVYSMLNPSSVKPQAELFKIFISSCIIISVGFFIADTAPHPSQYDLAFYLIEGITSGIFLMEYALRIYIITESRAYRHPLWGRLRYALSLPAVIDFGSFFPFFFELLLQGIDGPFLDKGSSRVLPNLEPLRALRIVRILKTRKVSQAVGVLGRVLGHNREVLLVAIVLCGGLLLLQSTMLYYFRPPAGSIKDEADFESIPATMFMSVLMLTTLRAPSGDFPWYTKLLISMNALTSVALLAIPTSMLTWGFEAEAQRIAQKIERKSMMGSPGAVDWDDMHGDNQSSCCSSSDTDSSNSVFDVTPFITTQHPSHSSLRPVDSPSINVQTREVKDADPYAYKLILEEIRSQRQELSRLSIELQKLNSHLPKQTRDACVATDDNADDS
eukprot:TRINITY_DN30680_c0_g1_i1.p1 TRINITY_DN30680_c0_g1~~TRINITY_DN30680_c0_g1_i1.p1  ORF type:complete len:472 (+),score=109.34 TRINITY_DN30680_c0_g1_i1:86-1501(+)